MPAELNKTGYKKTFFSKNYFKFFFKNTRCFFCENFPKYFYHKCLIWS